MPSSGPPDMVLAQHPAKPLPPLPPQIIPAKDMQGQAAQAAQAAAAAAQAQAAAARSAATAAADNSTAAEVGGEDDEEDDGRSVASNDPEVQKLLVDDGYETDGSICTERDFYGNSLIVRFDKAILPPPPADPSQPSMPGAVLPVTKIEKSKETGREILRRCPREREKVKLSGKMLPEQAAQAQGLQLQGESVTDWYKDIAEDSWILDQQTEEETAEEKPTDWEECDAFLEEWLEEKQHFMCNTITNRPLHALMVKFGEHVIKSEADMELKLSVAILDAVLTERMKSLEKVRARDVRPQEKTWVCEPVLYLPERCKWLNLQKYPIGMELLECARQGKPRQIHELVNKMGNIDVSLVRDARGRCVMHYACQGGNVAALEYFGPLANSLDAYGYAPIHVAAWFGNRICADRLVQLGADINMIDADGKTAFDYAKEMQMKCTMISLALNGSTAPDAEELASRYVEGLAGRTTTRKIIQGVIKGSAADKRVMEPMPVARLSAPSM